MSRLPTVRDGQLIVANIPMCDDQGCPSRTNCYRHAQAGRLAVAERQPYFAEPVRAKGEEFCPFYWPVRPKGVKTPRTRRVTVVQQYTIRNDPGQLKMMLRASEVCAMMGGIAPATLDGYMKRTDLGFPKPVKVGVMRQWFRREIEDYLKSDALRGVGARGRHAWIGGKPDAPAYPWAHSVQPEPNGENDGNAADDGRGDTGNRPGNEPDAGPEGGGEGR